MAEDFGAFGLNSPQLAAVVDESVLVSTNRLTLPSYMRSRPFIHVVDQDASRRGQIARALFEAAFHAEVYEDHAEFLREMPRKGLVIVVDQAGTKISRIRSRLGDAGIWLPIVAMSEHSDACRVVDAIRAGAVDYAWWPLDADGLRRMIERATTLAQELDARGRKSADARARIASLSRREREVLDYLTKGQSTRAIADLLAISPRTVEIHRLNMMGKLGARHPADAIRTVFEASWPDDLAA